MRVRLLATKWFLPFFLTQMLGVLAENLFKNALFILLIYKLAETDGLNGPVWVSILSGLFILPFFLFSTIAGQIADNYEKSRFITRLMWLELVASLLGAVGLFLNSFPLMVVVVAMLGLRAAFFGPAKYGILPDHLDKRELVDATALIGTSTFLAILVGKIGGSLLILQDNGVAIVAAAIIGASILGLVSARHIPAAPPPGSDRTLRFNMISETRVLFAISRANRDITAAIVGVSWFWMLGAVFLAQFPAFAREVLSADETVVSLFLAVFMIGIGIGSLLYSSLIKGRITNRYVPWAALAMSLFIFDLYWQTNQRPALDGLIGITAFLSTAENLRVAADLLGFAIAGGFFIVPLSTVLISSGDPAYRSRTVATANISSSLFMVAAAILTAALLAAEVTIPTIFLTTALVNLAVGFYIFKRPLRG